MKRLLQRERLDALPAWAALLAGALAFLGIGLLLLQLTWWFTFGLLGSAGLLIWLALSAQPATQLTIFIKPAEVPPILPIPDIPYEPVEPSKDARPAADGTNDALQKQLQELQETYAALHQEHQQLQQKVSDAKRLNPRFTKILHNVVVIGASGSGKTAIVLKLTHPYTRALLEIVSSPWEERFDRTAIVVQNGRKGTCMEHVLSFRVFNGEHKVRAQSEMIYMQRTDYRHEEPGLFRRNGVQGLVLVVDITVQKNSETGGDPRSLGFSQERINDHQDRYFDEKTLQFLVEPIRTSLQVLVLFINKSDCLQGLPGTPTAQGHTRDSVDALIEERFSRITKALQQWNIPVEVIVGSAYTDAGLTRLYSTLVNHILPTEVAEVHGDSISPPRP